MIRFFLLASLSIHLASCAYSVHQVYSSSFEPQLPLEKGGKVIKSNASQFVVMGFVQDTQYVNKAVRALEKKCPDREIGSVVSRFYTELGFFSWKNHVEFQGICRNFDSAKN